MEVKFALQNAKTIIFKICGDFICFKQFTGCLFLMLMLFKKNTVNLWTKLQRWILIWLTFQLHTFINFWTLALEIEKLLKLCCKSLNVGFRISKFPLNIFALSFVSQPILIFYQFILVLPIWEWSATFLHTFGFKTK